MSDQYFISVDHSALFGAPFGEGVEQALLAHLQVLAANAGVADTDGVLAAVDGTAHEITSGITNPPRVCNITATAGGTAGSIKAIQVVIEGTDFNGLPITETLPAFTVDTPGTVLGSKAFKTISKITIPAHDAANATTSIGYGEKLGLKSMLSRNTVEKAYLNNVVEGTPPTVTVDSDELCKNTADLSSALNGSQVDIYYWTE